ncbi:hypothetical protein B0O99DRAFT_267478 [Bisporella sp. PMI_857]|nr:hypothetical protein B0O99DRAFT_267478 [Bisporella sp. PMI_857]
MLEVSLKFGILRPHVSKHSVAEQTARYISINHSLTQVPNLSKNIQSPESNMQPTRSLPFRPTRLRSELNHRTQKLQNFAGKAELHRSDSQYRHHLGRLRLHLEHAHDLLSKQTTRPLILSAIRRLQCFFTGRLSKLIDLADTDIRILNQIDFVNVSRYEEMNEYN